MVDVVLPQVLAAVDDSFPLEGLCAVVCVLAGYWCSGA